MKISKRLNSLAVISAVLVLFLILVLSTASAASSPKITESRITTYGTASAPDIFGNNIVWQDSRNGNADIYIYDVSTHTELHTTNKLDQTDPAIYGNNVVWTDARNGGTDIYLQNLSTKVQTRITTSGKANNPAIYGNRIVWTDDRNNKGNIYMYDLSTKKETQISHSGYAREPRIYGDKITWLDYRYTVDVMGDYEVPEIFLYDLITQKETQIPRNNSCPGPNYILYGNKIIWQDYDYEDPVSYYNIYIYDLSTHKETQIVTNNSMQNKKSLVFSDIYGDKIVCGIGDWDGTSPENIYMYDLSTHIKTQITTSGFANNPKIYGNRIVYEDHRNSMNYKNDIYMSTLLYPSVADFSASPVSGKAPLTVKFTDKSTGSPTSWSWNFGDKTKSTTRSPTHKYTKAGKYTVSLTVKNAAGSNSITKSKYITVK
jgi:beta propeller repeat protein